MDQEMNIWQLVEQLKEESRRDPQALVSLIQLYKQILGLLQQDKDPLLYAKVQTSLGNAYYQSPIGDRETNRQEAITCYREALRYYTPELAPLDYAMAQTKLGNVYYQLLTGDRGMNQTQAIACYREALRFYTPETAQLDYAGVQANLGNAYQALLTGDHTENLKQAIACYQQALRFLTPETAPLEYSMIQFNLGNAYQALLTGDRAENLWQAISCYQQALRFWTPQAASHQYALTQHNLGNAYWGLPTGDRAENLKQAMACFQQALRFLTPETAPSQYASIQNGLGGAYHDLPTGDRAENLKQAMACYQQALRFLTPETAPLDYAMIQLNLGNVYRALRTGDRIENLKQAIACYQQALHFFIPEAAPREYAMVQHNLGNVYRDLPTGDRTENLRQAIACYQQALHFRTPETAPREYALTQNNLGNVCRDLPTGDRTENLRQAIACFQEALRFWTPESAPRDYAVVENNLGNTYASLPTGDQEANLKQAIACYQQALRFRTPETAPREYADTQNNIGNAYASLPTDDRAENLGDAIICYQQALRFRTPEVNPLAYAETQNNLGAVYSRLPTGDRATNLQRAIACYQQALRFCTPETAPITFRMTSSNLADLYFMQKKWKDALDAYHAAMDAGEQLYRTGLSSESKATEMAENAAFYRHAAFAAVRCGETAEALLILERGKTRLLTEALRLRVARPANVPDDTWREFEQTGAAVRATQAGNTSMPSLESDSVRAYLAREQAVREANAALETAILHVRVSAPEFLHPIDLSTIQRLLPDERTILVTFCITDQGSMGFVVSQNSDQSVQVIEMPTFTRAELSRILVERDAEGWAVGGWLGAYSQYLMKLTPAAFADWQKIITQVLGEFSQRLLAPILTKLPSTIERVILLPSAELFLLPLHAAPLSPSGAEFVGDRYVISYAPSIEVLSDARAKVMESIVPDLYAVINPQEDPRLIFTIGEGAAIARLFAQKNVDKGGAGTKQRVIAMASGRSYVHFSCHGSYNWNDPTQSGLELADGRLTLAELQQATIDLSSARLVTLSACETGMVDVFKGSAEEYVGIPAGLLLAGVPCVVCSLWSVPDLSTALLMERFYHNHMSKGMAIAEALREAQLWVRELSIEEVAQYAEQSYQQAQWHELAELYRQMRYYRAQAKQNQALNPFSHPYYWAAFTVNGM